MPSGAGQFRVAVAAWQGWSHCPIAQGPAKAHRRYEGGDALFSLANNGNTDRTHMKFDNSLEQVYLSDLQDLYDAEKQLVKALPKLAREVSSPKLSQGFQRHAKQTQEHAKRLEKIFQQHQFKSKGRRCPAMAGLIAEANETLEEDFSEQLLDVGVITAAQKVEHYEMSAYTSAIALAQALDFEADVRLLERTLREEEETERQLSTLCEGIVQQQQRSEGTWNQQREQKNPTARRSGRTSSRNTRRATA